MYDLDMLDNKTLDLIVSLLPESVQTNLVPIIGLTDTLNLLRELGGTRLYLSAGDHASSPLLHIIDADNIAKLQKHFGRVHINLPRCQSIILAVRNANIIKDYYKLDINQLALKYKLTSRQISTVLRTNPFDPALLQIGQTNQMQFDF